MMGLLVYVLMLNGVHTINIFDDTPYAEQIKRPNCLVDNHRYNSKTHKWEYGPYKYCVDAKSK